MDDPEVPEKKIVRVLAIDGGGIRGAAVAQFLKEMETRLGRPVHESFDMFAGTSIGGIMVAAMAYEKLPAATICDELMTHTIGNLMMPTSLADRVLSLAQTQPKFDGVGKRNVIDTYCGGGRHFCPKEWEEGATEMPFVVLTTYDVEAGKPKLHRNWDDNSDELLADVVDQTSAAPGFYPIVSSNTPRSGRQRGIDGAVFANNPTDCAYAEALKIYGPDADIRVLSIGTGESAAPPRVNDSDHVGGIQWLTDNDLLSIVYDGPQAIVDTRMRAFTEALGHQYARINGPMENMKMDDVSEWNIRALKRTGSDWWKSDGERALHVMGFNEPSFKDAREPKAITSADIGSDYKPYYTLVEPRRKRRVGPQSSKTLPYTPLVAPTQPLKSEDQSFLGWLFGL